MGQAGLQSENPVSNNKIETDLKNENTTSKIKHDYYKYRLVAEHMGLNPSTTDIKQKESTRK